MTTQTEDTELSDALAAVGLPAGSSLATLIEHHRANAALAASFPVVGLEYTIAKQDEVINALKDELNALAVSSAESLEFDEFTELMVTPHEKYLIDNAWSIGWNSREAESRTMATSVADDVKGEIKPCTDCWCTHNYAVSPNGSDTDVPDNNAG